MHEGYAAGILPDGRRWCCRYSSELTSMARKQEERKRQLYTTCFNNVFEEERRNGLHTWQPAEKRFFVSKKCAGNKEWQVVVYLF